MDMLQTLLRDYRRAVKDDPAPLLALFAEEAARAEAADLEAQLAAQQWRPGNVEPPAHDWYWVYDFADDDVPTRRFYGPQGWGMLGDEDAPDWYMAIPPLPAETTP